MIGFVSKRALNEDYDGQFWQGNLRNTFSQMGVNKVVEMGLVGQERFGMSDNQVYDKATSIFLLRAGIDGIQYPTEYLSKGAQRGRV